MEIKKYKIIDLQISGREFADGAIFNGIDEVIDQLADYHSIDFDGDIDEVLAKLPTPEDKLNFLLEYGEWALEEVDDSGCLHNPQDGICKTCGEVI